MVGFVMNTKLLDVATPSQCSVPAVRREHTEFVHCCCMQLSGTNGCGSGASESVFNLNGGNTPADTKVAVSCCCLSFVLELNLRSSTDLVSAFRMQLISYCSAHLDIPQIMRGMHETVAYCPVDHDSMC
jgi:hypothetical protein